MNIFSYNFSHVKNNDSTIIQLVVLLDIYYRLYCYRHK